MPSENYSTFADLHPEESSVSSIRDRRLTRGTQAAGDAFDKIPEHQQKNVQSKLKHLQNAAPALPQEAAKAFMKGRPTWGLIKSAFGIFRQVDMTKDWLFIILASFALLKDLFDVAFAAVGSSTSWLNVFPILGNIVSGATVAVGETVTFVFELLLLCLTAVVLVMVGSSLKNRGMAKYFAGIAIGFISEAMPGISWLPLAFIEVIVLYVFVLLDRAGEAQASSETQAEGEIPTVAPAENPQLPAYAAADGYEEQMAA